jgi:hypothetical protein
MCLSFSPVFLQTDQYQPPFWCRKIFDDSSFQNKLRERWSTFRQDLLSRNFIMGLIDSLVTLLAEAGERNFARWPVLGRYVWPNAFVGRTYQDEISYIRSWIDGRLEWLDRELGVVSAIPPVAHRPERLSLSQNFPNPFNPRTSIRFGVAERHHVSLKVFDLLGQEVAVLVDGILDTGEKIVEFDARDLASGIYVYQLRAGQSVQSRKMMVVR